MTFKMAHDFSQNLSVVLIKNDYCKVSVQGLFPSWTYFIGFTRNYCSLVIVVTHPFINFICIYVYIDN